MVTPWFSAIQFRNSTLGSLKKGPSPRCISVKHVGLCPKGIEHLPSFAKASLLQKFGEASLHTPVNPLTSFSFSIPPGPIPTGPCLRGEPHYVFLEGWDTNAGSIGRVVEGLFCVCAFEWLIKWLRMTSNSLSWPYPAAEA